jgi:hypothetical protein
VEPHNTALVPSPQLNCSCRSLCRSLCRFIAQHEGASPCSGDIGQALGAQVKIYPDVVINMTVSEETVVRRVYDPPPAPRPRDRPPPTVDEEGNPVDAEMPEEVPLPEKDELIDAIKAKREEETATMDATTEVLQAEGVHTVTVRSELAMCLLLHAARCAACALARVTTQFWPHYFGRPHFPGRWRTPAVLYNTRLAHRVVRQSPLYRCMRSGNGNTGWQP